VLVTGGVLDSSRPLPLLQTLVVDEPDYDRLARACLHHPEIRDLQLLVQCCPGLRDLQLGAAVEEHADLSPLQQLQQLTALSVCCALDYYTAQGLAALTQLRRLTVHTVNLPAVALPWLTQLLNLDDLDIQSKFDRGFKEVSEELLKHPEVTSSGLHLKTRPVS
jgi:hypothetical protein